MKCNVMDHTLVTEDGDDSDDKNTTGDLRNLFEYLRKPGRDISYF